MLTKELEEKMIQFFSTTQKTLFDLMNGAIPDDVTPIQYNILEYMYFSEESLLSSMAKCLYMSLPNTSREVKKLVGKGYIRREADLIDKRKHHLLLTDVGKALMGNSLGILCNNANEKYKGMSIEEQKETVELMDKLIKKIL